MIKGGYIRPGGRQYLGILILSKEAWVARSTEGKFLLIRSPTASGWGGGDPSSFLPLLSLFNEVFK